ncbi:hypothetical protein EfmGK923_03490 [Enterococcus faecium]|nr:hypothetical protein EfmGK923_03490 [Enterococcus faecium]
MNDSIKKMLRITEKDLMITEVSYETLQTAPTLVVDAVLSPTPLEVICTTDDPADDLHYHQLLAHEEPDLKVLPSFRPDKALNIEKEGFNAWVTLLEELDGSKLFCPTQTFNRKSC